MNTNVLHLCDTRVARLFELFVCNGVGLCVWKSADRWDEGVAGKTDFDVLVADGKIDEARALMLREGWIPANAESWRSFDGVYDYFTFVEERCLHIHLHSRIVSGEKMVKSLRPPLTSLYFDCLKQPGAYPPFVMPELELVFFLIRTVLKLSWIDIAGAVRRLSTRAVYRNYQHEYNLLRNHCEIKRIEQLLQDKRLECLPKRILLDAFDDITNLGWRERYIIRRAIFSWREVSFFGTWLPQILRGWRKRLEGVGKRLPFPGISVAICGPDGSGKTTTVNTLQEMVGRHLKVRRFYMGGNMAQPGRLRWAVMTPLWWPYLIVRKGCKLFGWLTGVSRLELMHKNLNLYFLHGEKQRRLLRAKQAQQRGEIVLFERYPLFYPYGDDLAKSVKHLPGVRDLPHLLVYLDLEEDLVMQRRQEEDPSILHDKVKAFRHHRRQNKFSNCEVLVLRGDAPIEQNVGKIMNCIDAIIGARVMRQELIANTE